MQAYIITLNDFNSEKNIKLKQKLEEHLLGVNFVKAIRGSELDAKTYYNLITNYNSNENKLISPNELGCILSHKKALEIISKSNQNFAAIFEDDVIINDKSLDIVKKLASCNITENTLIHLGGQEGLEYSFKNVKGKIILDSPRIFEINKDTLDYLHRTVGYIISNKLAKELLHLIDENPFIYDDFQYINNNLSDIKFLFCNAISHPINLNKSTIESERILKRSDKRIGSISMTRRIANEVSKTIRWKYKKLRIFLSSGIIIYKHS